MQNKLVRQFQPEDRSAVREICYLTGYLGESAEYYWKDRESFSDMWSGYYTDKEPESCFVAEVDGKVVGYSLGCFDSKNAWNPASVGTRHALFRGLIFTKGTGPAMWRTLFDVSSDLVLRRQLPMKPFMDSRWPSHLHIDILEEGRKLGLGKELINNIRDRFKTMGSPGLHLETVLENRNAVAFFKAMGFEVYGEPETLPGIRAKDGTRLHGLVMTMDLK